MIEVNEYIKKWSEKLSLSEDDIKKEFNDILSEEKKIHNDLSEEEQTTRAVQRLGMTYKKQLRSPAVAFEGMIIAAGDKIDIVARKRREAQQLYKENPQQAIAEGITDNDGIPLENRKEWANGKENFSYGKPLPEHNWLRTAYGIALKKNTEGAPKFFTMSLSGNVAENVEIPIFKPVAFRAIDKTTADIVETQYRLNSSMFTKFDEDKTIKMPPVEEVLSKYCNHMKVNLKDILEYHESVADDFNRLAIIEADVETLFLEPNPITGNRRMIIEDEAKAMEDLESRGTTCWIPEGVNIDFGEQSKVIVIGRTSRGKKMDLETRQQTDEPGDVMVNVYGLYALPKFKIQGEEIKEIKESNMNFEKKDTEEVKPKSEEIQTW